MSNAIRNAKGVLLYPVDCHHCGKTVHKRKGDINRARNRGLNIYCGRTCAGLANRSGKTSEQLRAEKAAYDREYRRKNADMLREKKRAAYYANHEENLRKQAELRAKIRADPERHAQYKEMARYYASRPEWKEKKRRYDRMHRAISRYGPEWGPAFNALLELEAAVKERATWNERHKHRLNRAQKHRREHEQKIQAPDRRESEAGSVEDASGSPQR